MTRLPRLPSRFAPLPRRALVLAVLACLGEAAHAQAGDEPPKLKLSRELTFPARPTSAQGRAADRSPSFIRANEIRSEGGITTRAKGDAELRKKGLKLSADELSYNQETDVATARGQVRAVREGIVYTGPFAQIETESGLGFVTQATIQIPRRVTGPDGPERLDGLGSAERVNFLDFKRAVALNGRYTTCTPDERTWLLEAKSVRFDLEDDSGVAENATLRFLGVPILYAPVLSFPLSDKRRSGFLAPTIGLSNRSGFEYSQPYYWNIAPNRDATLTPFLSTQRGVGVNSEFRYLEPQHKGELRLDLLPKDREADRSRGAAYARQDGALPWAGASYALNFARVTDDAYWKDFPRSSDTLSQRLLPADLSLSYATANSTASLRVLRWQTLQDAAAPIAPPYDILPRLSLGTEYLGVRGFDLRLDAEASRFVSQTLPQGQRLVLAPSVSFPIQTAGYYVTPKLAARVVRYQTERPMSDGRRSGGYSVPTVSVDAGASFERRLSFMGRDYLQTLEPRVFYVRTPFRDQSTLPVYDSSAYEFSFASIFSDNAFAGYDRISDSHALTIGASSRLVDPTTGEERARISAAQRLRLSSQRVSLSGAPQTEPRLSDLLLGASVNLTPRWSFEGTVQFDNASQRSVRSVLGVRYQPAPFSTLNAAYRFSKGNLEQLDLAWQWPLYQKDRARLYGVGRLNYSVNERRVTEATAGLEYEACCWMLRGVAQRVSTSTSSSNTKFFIQVEFSGLGRLGANPLATLKQNIPQYRVLREELPRETTYADYE